SAVGAVDAGPDVNDATSADAADSSVVCSQDLSNIGTGDFLITFALYTTNTTLTGVVNQRATCGRSMYWDIRTLPGSYIQIETDDGTHYAVAYAYGVLNNGGVHYIRASRVAGVLSISIDGAPPSADGGSVPSTTSFGALAPLKGGLNVCDGLDGGTA